MPCQHSTLTFSPSPHAQEAGYTQPSAHERYLASNPRSKKKGRSGSSKAKTSTTEEEPPPSTFPAPLVLPEDDLAYDPDYDGQGFQEWWDEEQRNPVTAQRKTVYVATFPGVDDEVSFVREWGIPLQEQGKETEEAPLTHIPLGKDLVEYLATYYTGMTVRLLPPEDLNFTAWSTSKKRSTGKKTKTTTTKPPRFIGLHHAPTDSTTRIRCRQPPDNTFPAQLNLNDLLDVAIAILPEDAYAILLLVPQDLYEDEQDDFCCGRAYGGSRVAVVSTARYDPRLDERSGVERVHAWPASHCTEYVEEMCRTSSRKKKKQKKEKNSSNTALSASPMAEALAAHVKVHFSPGTSEGRTATTGLWFSRVARTAAHELGHCFGLDHCVYYACAMQGTASVAEDARQPPYLCPVCLAKVLAATGADEVGRYRDLLRYCEGMGGGGFFGAYGAWVRGRLGELGGGGREKDDGVGEVESGEGRARRGREIKVVDLT